MGGRVDRLFKRRIGCGDMSLLNIFVVNFLFVNRLRCVSDGDLRFEKLLDVNI